jgi:N-acetylglucosaminyldiphosphoundecaprenol N-acetyl-beta-D-mannosaminyltransferase
MTHSLRDLSLFSGSYSDLVQEIQEYVQNPANPAAHLVTLNPEIWVDSVSNPILNTAIHSARWITADGIGIILGQRLLGITPSPRRTGSDLTPALLEAPSLRIFLMGSTHPVVEAAVKHIQTHYPNAIIAGYRDGFFPFTEIPQIAETLRQCQPDIILVGMGSPRQDMVIAGLKESVPHGVFIGVGGVIDMLAGTVKRSPKWMQTLGIEWLWRLTLQPHRIARLLKTIPRFIRVIWGSR